MSIRKVVVTTSIFKRMKQGDIILGIVTKGFVTSCHLCHIKPKI